jgi:PAS domain S-box-containing protein
MATQTGNVKTSQELQAEIKRLEGLLQEKTDRLQEAQETLEAIRSGAVDGLVRSTPQGDQVFLLKGSDQPYRNLIEEMNEGALLVSETGTILFCNHGFARLVDAPLEGIMGSNISDWVHPNSVSAFEQSSSNPVNKRKVFESTFKTTKQQPVATLVSVNKIALDSINASAFIVTDLTQHMKEEVKHYTAELEHEITERKKAEEALKESERKFKTLAENAPDAIMRFDKNLRVLYLNPADLSATGKRLDDFLGKTNEEMGMPQELCKLWNDTFERAKTTKKLQTVEFDYSTPAGIRTFSLCLVPEFDDNGSLVSYIGISRDITERKKAEEGLRLAQAKLQEYAKNLESIVEERTKKLKDAERLAAIGQVAGMVGHDIRNPLQAIVGELYFAKESMKDFPKERVGDVVSSIDFIQEQADYISKIVSDLQDYARALRPDFTSVELCEFISNAVKSVIIPDNIETAFICEKQIPQIKLDKTFTTRILTNLINNAVQAMPKGGKLTLKAVTQENSAVITIEDTGVGIPEEVKSKMFTPLFTTKSKGQGFGLAVVKRLVEAQGGTIGFESEAGKGTKFTVTLPLTR